MGSLTGSLREGQKAKSLKTKKRSMFRITKDLALQTFPKSLKTIQLTYMLTQRAFQLILIYFHYYIYFIFYYIE